MTRSIEEYRQILELWTAGTNKKAISRITGIPRRTVIDCIQRYGDLETLEITAREVVAPILLHILEGKIEGNHTAIHAAYAYLLGLYLGDGHIIKMPRVFRLRVFLDIRYPQIIEACRQAMLTLFPNHHIGSQVTHFRGKESMAIISLYHKDLPVFFPQHGEGMKHTRKIELADWQQRIIMAYPLEFFRGLYHSDGSRFINRVKVRGNNYEYIRYQFTNYSDDIRKLFCDTCDRLGLSWTEKTHASKHYTGVTDIFISKRPDVEYLDSVIGAKA
jgi:hypothetical protein